MYIIYTCNSLHTCSCIGLRQIVSNTVHRNQSFLRVILAYWNHMVWHFYLFGRAHIILVPNEHRASMSWGIQRLTVLVLLASHIERWKYIHGPIGVDLISLFRWWFFKSLGSSSLEVFLWRPPVSVLALFRLSSLLAEHFQVLVVELYWTLFIVLVDSRSLCLRMLNVKQRVFSESAAALMSVLRIVFILNVSFRRVPYWFLDAILSKLLWRWR